MLPAARDLDRMARRRGGRTVLFESWGYREGDEELSGDTYWAMQQRLFNGYGLVRARLDAAIAPVGAAWRDAVSRDPCVDLWENDGIHPTPLGSYLTACVFYAVLTGRNPTRSSFTGGLDRTQAQWLAEVANRAVPDRARLR
jgi:hypothetical protein